MFCRKCGKDIGELEKCPFCDFEEYAKENGATTPKSNKSKNGKKGKGNQNNTQEKAPFNSSKEAIKKWRKQSKIGKAAFALQTVALSFFGTWILGFLFLATIGEASVGFMTNLPITLGFSNSNDPKFLEFFANKLVPGLAMLLSFSSLLLFTARLLDDFAKISFGKWLHKKKYSAKRILSSAATRDKVSDDYLTLSNWVSQEKSGRVISFVNTGVGLFLATTFFLFFSTFFSKLSYALFNGGGKEALLSFDFFALMFLLLALAVFGIVMNTIRKKKSEEFLSK